MALLQLPGFCSFPLLKLPRLACLCFTAEPTPRKFALSASSIKKPRVRKKAKSNADLCNDLKEFISVVGFPEGHVPSTKELLQHGRKDLANIVRRRGYKLVAEILANPKVEDIDGPCKEPDLLKQMIQPVLVKDLKVDDLADDINPLSKISRTGGHTFDAKIDSGLDNLSRTALEPSINSSLHDKVSNFIQNGDLDSVGDIAYSNLDGRAAELTKEFNASEDSLNIVSSNVDEKQSECVGRRVATVLNGSAKRSHLAGHIETNTDHVDKEFDVEASNQANQEEINHLQFMLHQKELELSRLKEQIEKEKLALNNMQKKAEMEIDKAKQLILETDAELHATEESLSGLKEVEIEYVGDANDVEVAGSFNGWHQHIKLDPHDASGSRKLKLWTTALWLYPGVYEIKFIVDGHWRIDPQKELITSGTIQNNLLRVER